MMKRIYIGLVTTGLMAISGVAHAGEQASTSYTYSAPQAAQPYNVAYKVDRQITPQKRIVRVVKVEAPRARMINGSYQLPKVQPTTRRRIVTQPLKPMPNLYASVASSATPILFDKTAMQAR